MAVISICSPKYSILINYMLEVRILSSIKLMIYTVDTELPNAIPIVVSDDTSFFFKLLSPEES